MAYMSQEKKAEIAAELKKVMPKDWKYSLSVDGHSTLVLTISAAPVDLLKAYNEAVSAERARFGNPFTPETEYVAPNLYHLDTQFTGPLLETFQTIKKTMNAGNHDRSDLMTDYFDVGWYVKISIGRWNKPFRFIAPEPAKPELTYDELKAKVAELERQLAS